MDTKYQPTQFYVSLQAYQQTIKTSYFEKGWKLILYRTDMISWYIQVPLGTTAPLHCQQFIRQRCDMADGTQLHTTAIQFREDLRAACRRRQAYRG